MLAITFRVVLKPGYLFIYKGREAKTKSREIHLLISTVRQCGSSVDSKNNKTLFLFEVISPGVKKLVLGCKSEEERDKWVKAISDVISNSLDNQPTKLETLNKKKEVEQDEYANLQRLQAIPGNKFCADCATKGPIYPFFLRNKHQYLLFFLVEDPNWASANLGILICMECSGVHRSLGTHISRVKSTTLDQWSEDLLAYMEKLGNERSNQWFEMEVKQAKLTPEADRPSRESFISAKYKDLTFTPKRKMSPQEASEQLYQLCTSTEPIKPSKNPKLTANTFYVAPSATDLLSKYFDPNKVALQVDTVSEYETEEEEDSGSEGPENPKTSEPKRRSLLLTKTSAMSPSLHNLSKDAFSKEKNSPPTESKENSPRKKNEEASAKSNFANLIERSSSFTKIDTGLNMKGEEREGKNGESTLLPKEGPVVLKEKRTSEGKVEEKKEETQAQVLGENGKSEERHFEFQFFITLLRQGADLNYTDPVSLKTCLHQVCFHDKDQLLFSLLVNGADLGKQDALGWTPLHYVAANAKSSKCVSLFMRSQWLIQKSHLTIKDSHDRDALLVASSQDNQAFVNLFSSLTTKQESTVPVQAPKKTKTSSPSSSAKLKSLFKGAAKSEVTTETKKMLVKDRSKRQSSNVKNNGSVTVRKKEDDPEQLSRDIAALDIDVHIQSPFDNEENHNGANKERKRANSTFWKKKK